jgi:hypothetical protein
MFIGEPNTGKSNILETLALISHLYYGFIGNRKNLRDFVRMEDFTNIFYDRDFGMPLKIVFDSKPIEIKHANGAFSVTYDNKGLGSYRISGESNIVHIAEDLSAFKFYRFKPAISFIRIGHPHILLPPMGENMVMSLQHIMN